MEDKIISLESMKNISIDKIIELYRNGYRLEGSVIPIPTKSIYDMSPDSVSIIYTQAYDQGSGKMTADLLVRNDETSPIVVQFKFYDANSPYTHLKDYIACIQPYSNPQNANGCTKFRVTDITLKDPYKVYVYRCISYPNCTTPSCVAFSTNVDSSCIGSVVLWTGNVPSLDNFPANKPPNYDKCSGGTLNMPVDCASCDPAPNWICETIDGINTGYKSNTCTGQRQQDLTMCPLPPSIKDDQISVSANKSSPFDKGEIVRFSGTLQSAASPYPGIAGASVILTIKVGGATTSDTPVTRPTDTNGYFYYDWTVPSTLAGVDTSGMSVVVTTEFEQTSEWKANTATSTYAVVGTACTGITMAVSKTTANVGEKITITALTQPTSTTFPVIINVDGSRLGSCTTVSMGSIGHRHISSRGYNIRNLQDTLTLVSPPASAMAGQSVNFQLNYNLSVDVFGEWVRFRICSGTTEIGSHVTLLFGNLLTGIASGTTSFDATIPADASGIISVKGEITIDEFSSTCGDPDVIASTSPVNVSITGPLNTMSIINPPSSVIPGQTVDIQLNYNLSVSDFGEWVRFRICDSTGELGNVFSLLFGNEIDTITVSATIPSSATGTIVLHGEVTTDELNSTCGDPGVIARTSDRTVSIVTQSSGTISIIDPPLAVRPGQSVDFKVGYNLNVSSFGEWVRFRICSGSTEIGHSINLFFGTNSGVVTINSVIPNDASGTVSIKAEFTDDELNATCGSAVVTASSIANITVTTLQPGVCQITWDTTGSSGGDHYITGLVLGQCATTSPLKITLVAPPAPCTSISIGISEPTPTVGDVVTLTAIALPYDSTLKITFKANGKAIGSGCVTSAGRCTTNWNTAGLTPGVYKLIASVESGGVVQCASTPMDVTLASTTAGCTSITTPGANPATATIGGTVVLTADVQPTSTIFPVAFKDQNNNVLGTINTVSGTATLNWNTTGKTAGPYQISSSVGSQCTSPSTITVTLIAAATCTSITTPTASPSTETIGKVITLTVGIQPSTSIFTVDFKDQNNNVIGSANTVNGIATLPWNTTGKSAGTYQIKAFTGTCTSQTAVTVTLNPAVPPCTSITTPTATPTTVTIGGTVVLTATVQPTTAIYAVDFKDQNNNILGTANTLNGVATLNWSTAGKSAGPYQIKGSVGTACVSSTAITVTLNTATATCTSVTIPTATPTSVKVGEVVTLSATAQPTTAVFTVDFKDQNNHLIGSANTTAGVASYVWNTGPTLAGSYQIKAYVGAMCISTSATTVTINPATVACTSVTTPLAMPTTVAIGQILALRATVQPTSTIFTVNFKDQNNSVIGSANTNNGVATYNWDTTGKTAGTYQIKAYVGASCISPSSVTITITGAEGIGSITFVATATGQPIAGVAITVDGVSRGNTGSNGQLPSPVAGLTLGITHLYKATKEGYPDQSGSTMLTTDKTVTINMSAAPPAAGGGTVIIAAAAIGIAALYIMKKKPKA